MLRLALLYVRTIRHFRCRQLLSLVMARLSPAKSAKIVFKSLGSRFLLKKTNWLVAPHKTPAERSIVFLNEEREFDIDSPDWRAAGAAKLWRYNLHYFDFLLWQAYSTDDRRKLIHDWIKSNPIGTEDAWEPYPLSLRIVNWIKYFLSLPPEKSLPSIWLKSLAQQTEWLSRNIETHLLGNHYLTNGKALVFGGLYYRGERFARHFDRGLRIMVDQADEQFLSDGGHFERSIQYHCIVLTDYLDVLNLLAKNPGFASLNDVRTLEAAAGRGLSFLSQMISGDGRIPLFNDAAFGISPEPDDLIEYGQRVLDGAGVVRQECHRICMPETGYFGYREGSDSLILDCGPVGPDYQPGHAHCDTLSYELCVDGLRWVVDSGVYEYEQGDMRDFSRSTAAHNTVRVDGEEQSEVWASFRVARRARPVSARLSEIVDGQIDFSGSHDGYRRLPGRVTHHRRIHVCLNGKWQVGDRIDGSGVHRVESFIHFHPSVEVDAISEREFLLVAGERRLKLYIDCAENCRQETGWYCPEFGLRKENTVLVLEAAGELPVQLQYTFSRA